MFDFYKEFLGVDIAKVEQVTELVGRVVAVFMTSMISNGISEQLALQILKDAENELLRSLKDYK